MGPLLGKPTAWNSGVKRTVSAPGSVIRGLGLVMVTALMASVASAEPPSACCRVNNRLAAFNNVGSGTLIDRSDDGQEGLVLTCAHLFSEGVGEVVVSFPDGKTHGAKLVAIDREADLAALAISNPAAAQAEVEFAAEHGEPVKACGFGPHGEYACASGLIVGEAANGGQASVLIGGAVRSGDSGGGVFDADGNLVAVVWGEAHGVTYASAGVPLKRFLDRVLGQRTRHVYACPNGMCPRPGVGGGVKRPHAFPARVAPPPASESVGVDGSAIERDDLKRRVAALEQNKQDRGDYVTRSEATQFMAAANERYESLARQLEGRAPHAKPRAAESFVEWIGIATPAGWGVVAATTIGGWFAGRLLRRGVGGRREGRFPSVADE